MEQWQAGESANVQVLLLLRCRRMVSPASRKLRSQRTAGWSGRDD